MRDDMQPALQQTGPIEYFDFLSGRLRILLLVPLIVGVLAFLATLGLPKAYVSSATILVPQDAGMSAQQAASVMTLEPVLRAIDSAQDLDEVARRVSARVGRDGLVRVDVSGSSPAEAQRAAAALLEAWLKSTVPSGRERAELVARRDRAQIDLDNVQGAITSITKGLGSGERQATEGMLKLAILSETADRYFTTLQQTTRRLEGLRSDVIVQQPSLPRRPRQPGAIAVAVGAAFIALFVTVAALLVGCRLRAARSGAASASGEAER